MIDGNCSPAKILCESVTLPLLMATPLVSASLLLTLVAPSVCQFTLRSNFFSAGDVTADHAAADLSVELTASDEKLTMFSDGLRPIFIALPKNAFGNLDFKTGRYALHRFFVAQHSWYIRGLEPTNGKTEEVIERDRDAWVPTFLLKKLETSMGEKGLSLHDLAAMAAALEDLVVEESNGRLGLLYAGLQQSKDIAASRSQLEFTLETHLIIYLCRGNFSFAGADEIRQKVAWFKNNSKSWPPAQTWLSRHVQEHSGPIESDKTFTFSEVQEKAALVGKTFGFHNDKECTDLKASLMEMVPRSRKAGRIRLADFYRQGIYTRWGLTEKQDYLKALGALDDSNASNPLVIISNYIQGRENCLDSSKLYALCCRNECEDLLATLEKQIKAPTAAPGDILALVENLSSPTVAGPRKLQEIQVSRLHDMAAMHGGQVNIHGRLFSQWMHHLYPNECPFPHEGGMFSIAVADFGDDEKAHTDEEVRALVDADRCTLSNVAASAAEMADLPWSMTEELLVPPAPAVSASSGSRILRGISLLISAGLAVILAWTAKVPSHKLPYIIQRLEMVTMRQGIRWQVPAILALVLFAFLAGLVNKFFFFLGSFGGVSVTLAPKLFPDQFVNKKKILPM